MENVLEVYKRPYDPKRPIVCMDEKPKQLVKETRTPIACGKGQVECFAYEYERNGTANVFLFVEPLRGWRRVEVTERRTRIDWAQQIKRLIGVDYKKAEKITLVMDNLNTHGPASLYEAFAPAEVLVADRKAGNRAHAQARQLVERRRGRVGGAGKTEHRRARTRPRVTINAEQNVGA